MPNQAHDAFVAYAREDGEFALRLAKDLKAAEALVWLDQLDIKPGERWIWRSRMHCRTARECWWFFLRPL
jgi:hypothetical protein